VLLLAMLGNGYLLTIVTLVCVLFAGLVASIYWFKAAGVKLAAVVGVFLWLVVKALWVRVEPPQGREVAVQEAPGLFSLIEGLRRALGAPRFHHVLVTDDFNAGVVQSPRLGIFGWPRNYLLLGLPLMKSLGVEQFRAVLAHEFGHLARGHGRMSNWLYRQRLRWSRLMQALEEVQSGGTFLFKPFLNWFAPYFNAYSFPLARANEYEADATSVRLTSRQAAAEALTGTRLIGRYLHERYWPGIYRRADESPSPAFAPFHGMGRGVSADLDAASRETWLNDAMSAPTTVADTHPALKDRLSAIGEVPRVALPARGEAADQLLGGALDAITGEFDRRWKERIEASWEERYQEVQDGRRELAALEARHASGETLELREAYRRAMLTESFGGNADGALEQFRSLAERSPDHPAICHALGARLAARDDAAGAAFLERAMRGDEKLVQDCCERLRDLCGRLGRRDEADAWHRRLVAASGEAQAAEKERSLITVKDTFYPHGLPEEAIGPLRAQLRAIPRLRKAYLLRKRVEHFPHRPLYVLGFAVRAPWWSLSRKKLSAQVQQAIQEGVEFPGETMIFSIEGENYRFGRKFWWKRTGRLV